MAREWIDSAIAFLREHAKRMREPMHWQPPGFDTPPTLATDRNGNHTARPSQQITPLRALDDSGREWTILKIVPMEPVTGYDRLRFIAGRARYELKDGTPIVQHSETLYEVGGNTLKVKPQPD